MSQYLYQPPPSWPPPRRAGLAALLPPPLAPGSASFGGISGGAIVVAATDASGGTPPYTYQWQRSTVGGGVGFANLANSGSVAGATTRSLADGSAAAGTFYFYRLAYTDSAGSPATATGNEVQAQANGSGGGGLVLAQGWRGDFRPGRVVRLKFNSINTGSAPTTLANGSVVVSRDGSDVAPSGGVTLAVDVGGVVGRNSVVVDTSVDPSVFVAGSDYEVRLAGTSTVAGISAAGMSVGEWSILNRSVALDAAGRVNAGKFLDQAVQVDPNGLPAVNLVDVSGQGPVTLGGAVSLSAPDSAVLHAGAAQAGSSSTITLASAASATSNLYKGARVKITAGTGAGQCSRVIVAYDGPSRVATLSRPWAVAPDSTSVYAVVDAEALATDPNLAATAGTVADKAGYGLSSPAVQAIWDNLLAATYAVGGIGAKLKAWALGSDNRALVSADSHATGATTTVGGYAANQDPASLLLDVQATAHNAAGTIGARINTSGAVADPWAATLPGSYGANTAGNIVGNRLDLAVGSRQPAGPVTVGGYSANQDPATLLLDVQSASHAGAGTVGAKIAAAGTAADPWTANLSTYGVGTAGRLVAQNLDAAVSTRSTFAGGPVASVAAPVTVGTNNDKAGYSVSTVLDKAGYSVSTVTDKAGYALAAAGLDAVAVEAGVNARQALALIGAVTVGKAAGLNTGTATFYAMGNPGTQRVLASGLDTTGNRPSLTLSPPP